MIHSKCWKKVAGVSEDFYNEIFQQQMQYFIPEDCSVRIQKSSPSGNGLFGDLFYYRVAPVDDLYFDVPAYKDQPAFMLFIQIAPEDGVYKEVIGTIYEEPYQKWKQIH